MASPFPSVFSPGVGCDGRHGLVSNPSSSFFVTQCRQQLQGHQTCFPAALQAWTCSGALFQVKPHPRDQRLSPGMHQPEESLHCPGPAQCHWSHARTPPPIVVPAQGRCGARGWAMLGSRPRSVGEVMVLTELWPVLELMAHCESHSNRPNRCTAEAQAPLGKQSRLLLFIYSLIKREKYRGERAAAGGRAGRRR